MVRSAEARVDDADDIRVDEVPQVRLFFAQLGFGAPVLGAQAAVAQLALHRGGQPLEVLLDQIVGGAGAHRLHRGLFADGAGDDDEGNIELGLLHQLQRSTRAEARHAVIREDQVPAAPRQSRRKCLGGVDALELRIGKGPLQLGGHQQEVVFRILGDQDMQPRRHDLAGRLGAGWLSSSQKIPSCLAASVNSAKSTGLRT